jgi:hypothetical protein
MGTSMAGITRLITRILVGSEPAPELTTEDGSTLRVEHHPAPGARVRIRAHPFDGGADITVTAWAPASERPSTFPEDLPFVLGTEIVDFMSANDAAPRSISYWGVEPSDAIAAAVIAQSISTGWLLEAPLDLSFAGMQIARMRRGNRDRSILPLGDAPTGILLQDMAIPKRTT